MHHNTITEIRTSTESNNYNGKTPTTTLLQGVDLAAAVDGSNVELHCDSMPGQGVQMYMSPLPI